PPASCRCGPPLWPSLEWPPGIIPGLLYVVNDNEQNSDLHDALVRLLRPRQDAARRPRARVRRTAAGRRSGVSRAAPGADRRLDRPADPDRRPPDRRLHRALAARPRGPARRAPRGVAALRGRWLLAARAVPGAAAGGPDLLDWRPAARA